MNSAVKNVLVLCTGNSARSILAEALFNHLPQCQGKFRAYSAGSFPTGRINPFALETLANNGIPDIGFRSKSWDEFATPDSPTMHYIVTVCDQAAGEACPVWPGKPLSSHWGISDPAGVAGSDDEKRQAFTEAFTILKRRIELFAGLPFAELSPADIKARMAEIGKQ